MSDGWRLVMDGARDGLTNMALDRAMQLACEAGECPPTVRLYQWARPTVSLGHFQALDGVDLDACRAYGVDVVRRHTGGRGVLHDDELTYSVVARTADGIPRQTTASYRLLSAGLVHAYTALGVEAELVSRTQGVRGSSACYLHSTQADLAIGDAKLSGSAQVWAGATCLQHGSITRSRDIEREAAVFRLEADDGRRLASSASTLEDLFGAAPSVDRIAHALIDGFEQTLGVRLVLGEHSVWELETAARITDEGVPE